MLSDVPRGFPVSVPLFDTFVSVISICNFPISIVLPDVDVDVDMYMSTLISTTIYLLSQFKKKKKLT